MFDAELMKAASAAVKTAVTVDSPSEGPLRFVADSVGRVNALRPAVTIGQEKAFRWLAGPNEDDARGQADIMNAAFPDALKGVKVRLGGPDVIDDVKRIWKNPHTGYAMKGLGYLTLPGNTLSSVLGRSDHYNPMTDVAQIYNGIPQVVGHELGHAADFNSKKPFARSAYLMGSALERMPAALGFPGPFTHWQELAANRNYLKALGQQKDEVAADQGKRDAWRRLAPAYATYAAATGLGGLYLASPDRYKQLTGAVGDMARNVVGDKWAPLAAGVGLTGVATLLGRLAAETRNALTSRPESKPEPSAKLPAKGVNKPEPKRKKAAPADADKPDYAKAAGFQNPRR